MPLPDVIPFIGLGWSDLLFLMLGGAALVGEGWQGVATPVPLATSPLADPAPVTELAEGPVLDLPLTRGPARRALWYQVHHQHPIAPDADGLVTNDVADLAATLTSGGCADPSALGFTTVVARREGPLHELGPLLQCLGKPSWDDGAVAVWRSERATRSSIVSAFGKYLSPTVVDRLAENPDLLKLGGETRDLTVMFCDLRNFTTLSEGLDAAELTAFMNAYLTPLTDAVLEAHGTVDKYIGDAMMAFWNAPLDDAEHCRHAVAAALAIRAALVEFRAQRAEIDRAAGRSPRAIEIDRKSTRLNSSHSSVSRMPSSA